MLWDLYPKFSKSQNASRTPLKRQATRGAFDVMKSCVKMFTLFSLSAATCCNNNIAHGGQRIRKLFLVKLLGQEVRIETPIDGKKCLESVHNGRS